MNSQSPVYGFLPRVAMFTVMLALIVYSTHFILPTPAENGADAISLNPLLQIGLFLALTIFGGLVGFWITFGDLINRSGDKPH